MGQGEGEKFPTPLTSLGTVVGEWRLLHVLDMIDDYGSINYSAANFNLGSIVHF